MNFFNQIRLCILNTFGIFVSLLINTGKENMGYNKNMNTILVILLFQANF